MGIYRGRFWLHQWVTTVVRFDNVNVQSLIMHDITSLTVGWLSTDCNRQTAVTPISLGHEGNITKLRQ